MTESWKQTDLSNTTTTDQYQYILGLLPMQEGDGKLPPCRVFSNVFCRILPLFICWITSPRPHSSGETAIGSMIDI